MFTIRRSWKAILLGFVAAALSGFHNAGWSEDLPPPSGTTTAVAAPAAAAQQESNGLEQRLKILERKLEVADEAAASKAGDVASVKADRDGFQIVSPKKDFVLKLRALIQADGRFFVQDKAGNETDQFLVRKLRPILEGTLFSYASFRITPDFASNARTALYDAYIDVAPWTFAKLRAGKFKPPIGLEHLQSDENVVFAERGLPSLLVPSRDTGVQFFGDAANGAVSYAASFTNGVGDNNTNAAAAPQTTDGDVNDSKEGTARLAAKPFKNSDIAILQGLGLGFAASYSKQLTTNPSYSSPGQVSIFAPAAGALSDGAHIRLAPDVNWYYHSLGLYGEWVQSSQVWRVGQARSTIVNQAWQAGASYVLTGEDASYTGVKPRKPFDVKNDMWGAWEVGGRVQQLYLDPDNFTKGVTTAAASVQRAQSWGVVANWYLNNNLRWTTDFNQTTFDRGAAVGDRVNEKVLLSRWQLVF